MEDLVAVHTLKQFPLVLSVFCLALFQYQKMPETRLFEEEEVEEEEQRRTLQDRGQTTDLTGRTKTRRLDHSQGPLSSLRAAIKRTRTNSQGDNRAERRRPNITIVSVEPLTRSAWFTGGPVVFPPQTGWSTGIPTASQLPPSYDQVIKEKTETEQPAKPTAAPRQSGTQTQLLRKHSDPHCGAASPHPGRNPAANKPQKPPRSSFPKASEVKRGIKVVDRSAEHTSTEGFSRACDPDHWESDESVPQRTSRSVTVHWTNVTDHQSDSASVQRAASNLDNAQRPVPRPRTKLNKNDTKEEHQTLVTLGENCDVFQSFPRDVPTNKYLEELLEVFGERSECEEGRYYIDQLYEKSLDEDADGTMSDDHNHRNIRARIQAFESQTGTEEDNGSQAATPNLPPRRATYRPPVASKPPATFKPNGTNNSSQNMFASQNSQNQEPLTRPKPPTKPVGHSVREELEALHSNGGQPHRSRPFGLTRSDGVDKEEPAPLPPVPPVKPFKEPLRPNLNINNYNSHEESESVAGPVKKVPLKPQYSLAGDVSSVSRQGTWKRPTTIRVPSKAASDNFLDDAPPLPVKKPIGSTNSSSASYKETLRSSKSFQNTFSAGPEPPLPPRKLSGNISLPPRPPPAKTGPGRPPPPSLQAVGRSQSEPQRSSPKFKSQKPTKKGLVLPPRPAPGHRLYNNYMLPLPHGIASADFDGRNSEELTLQKDEVILLLEKISHSEFECQIGETRGRVHKSRMKIITPLDSDFSHPQEEGAAASGGCADGLKVKALHDFVPEGPSELSLSAGDVVTEVEQVDSQWYRGTCNGSTGFFPISYVEVLSKSPTPLAKKKKTQAASVSGPRCVARFEFEGEHSDELSFSEGDVIQLKEYVGEDWARGQVGVSVGIFPLNFVEVIEDLPPPPRQQPGPAAGVALPGLAAHSAFGQAAAAKPAQTARSGVQWAVALYDYAAKTQDELSFQKDDCILITEHLSEEWSSGRLNGREGMFPRAFVDISSGEQQDGAAGCLMGTALYSFTSDCEEELSLKVGDIVTKLESVDDEWFLGELRGKRALVPKNYLQVLD
ncbi:SH3 domain-containing protein 19 isoform X2 [Poecilia latipinna]|uniref:SH3 domain-containing protein 19 isoform X2 n=1 Tax=Poecilia latipinna TaxID=48699 RepID=UPI00072DCD8A|nr:PREDICTED: SH3 domain-containing protein 19 isoform X2 [Poecilia latipinna]